MKKLGLSFVFVVFIILGLNYALSYFGSKYIKNNVIGRLPAVNGIKADVGGVWVNLLFLKVNLKNLTLSAPDGYISSNLLDVKNIHIDIELIPLFFRKIIIKKLTIDEPVVNVELKNKDNALPLPLPVLDNSASESIVSKIVFYGQNYAYQRKYPPVTLENVKIKNCSVRFINLSQDSENLIVWENISISIPRFWRSLDYSKTEAEYLMTGNVKDGGGFMRVKGSLNADNGVLSNEGVLEIIDLDMNRIHKFNKNLLPVKNVLGKLSVKGDLAVDNNTASMPLEFNFRDLKFEYFANQKRVYGLNRSMLQELLNATGGQVNFTINIEGDIYSPSVDVDSIPNQLIKQYLLKSAEEDMSKKADRYGRYLKDKIMKK